MFMNVECLATLNVFRISYLKKMCRFSWLHLLYLLFCCKFYFCVSSGHLCHPEESSALFRFKNSFSIHTSRLYNHVHTILSWDEGTDCCTWNGVTCHNFTGHVIGLDLSDCGLQGNIYSNSSLFSLGHLQSLDLSQNDFGGSLISSKFKGFVSMTHLDLSYSSFSGSIPLEISHLSNLVVFRLLSATTDKNVSLDTLGLKRIVQNLTNLRELSLETVDMSSVVLDYSLMNLSSSLTSLRLYGCQLRGKFPESIFHLSNLQSLYLGDNDALTGSLPKSNWSSALKILDLSFTRIPIDWNHLTRNLNSLKTLYLRTCNFVGSYPSFLGNLTQIISLDLAYNYFGGHMPWSFLTIGRLVDLDLSGNNFVGQFSQVVYSNSSHWNLTSLFLRDNSLNGTIPSWLYSLPRLERLYLGMNRLSGNIMEFQSTSLKELGLRYNMLHGLIPSSIFKQVNLEALLLASNNLSGSIEFFENFSKLQSLVGLDLSFNNLSFSFNNYSSNINSWPQLWYLGLSSCNISDFPDFSGITLPQLQTLDLSYNRIQGNLPKWWWDMEKKYPLSYLNLSHNFLTGIEQISWTNLEYLDLRSNFLQGGIPFTICNLSSLQVLDLSNNKLSGKIPPCIGNFSKSLSVLDLKRNKFVGTIPETFSRGNTLRNLDLNGNQLEGPLPRSLSNCRKLEVLDLGNNKMNGTFPTWLETLPMLQVLILRSNRLHGPISNPSSPFPFQKLRIMDLSHNQFSGSLPSKYFDKLKGMINVREDVLEYMGQHYYPYFFGKEGGYYQDTVTVVIKGLLLQLEKIQTMFTIIDFSNNLFKGEIPDAIGELNSLKGLNLSHNQLTGLIPPSFCNLTKLEWLDLSANRLVGEIPRHLANLISLAKLNLSENQLVGSIPRGKQFETFDNDSYLGNVGLCGFPLTKKCDNEDQEQGDEDSEHVGGIFDWRAALMGCGCGVVIGLSLGYMVLISSRKVDRVLEGVGRELRCKLMKRSRRSPRKRV